MRTLSSQALRILSSRPTSLMPSLLLACMVALSAGGCALESHQALNPESVASRGTVYTGPRYRLMVGNFQNRSTYMQGIFSDGVDRLGNQAKTALVGHLQQTGRFTVVDRQSMDDLAREAGISGTKQKLTGAQVAITGEVTEFGRRNTGDRQLFGILGSGAKQAAYAKVVLNVVDVRTSEVVYSANGAGEYALSNREVLGFASTADYDATLNGKVLDLAIREAVNRLVEGLEARAWTPSEDRGR